MSNNKQERETVKQVTEENTNKEELKKELFKKWWFWLIIAIVLIIIVGTISENTNTIISANTTNETNSSKTTSITIENNNKNPYEVIKDYDGVYKFVLNSDNGSGKKFKSVGVISFNNGISKTKFLINSNTYNDVNREYQGFCGYNKEDGSSFYFTLNDEKIVYKCTKTEDGFSCKLISSYDLSGCISEELNLLYEGNIQSFNEIFTQVNEEEKAKEEEEKKIQKQKEEQEFKSSCQTYTFEQMARNPDNFKGTNVKVTGKVVQVMSNGYSTDLRVNITKTGRYTTYYTDTIYVVYHLKDGEDKILEDDIITIYGTSQGDCSYTSVMGSTVTLPNIKAEYITINK